MDLQTEHNKQKQSGGISMGFLERAIRRGISQGIGNAIGNAVQQVIEPTATQLANKAAQHFDQATQTASATPPASGLQGAFANLERAAQGYATQMSKNMKICPSCGQATTADKSFCPSCGAQLPEQTVAQGAQCPSCGRQNTVGTKFCEDCGTKLPATVQNEQAQQANDAQVLALWNEMLSAYPQWNCGGTDYCIEDLDGGFVFSAKFSTYEQAQQAVQQYRGLLQQNGFRQAGKYPSIEHLYKKENGICRHVDTEHCFESDADRPSIYFSNDEPTGGFDYTEPEPKKPTSFRDLFGF